MTDMPDEIWILFTEPYSDGKRSLRHWQSKPLDGGAKYIRADLAPSSCEVREAVDWYSRVEDNLVEVFGDYGVIHIETLIRAAQSSDMAAGKREIDDLCDDNCRLRDENAETHARIWQLQERLKEELDRNAELSVKLKWYRDKVDTEGWGDESHGN